MLFDIAVIQYTDEHKGKWNITDFDWIVMSAHFMFVKLGQIVAHKL